MVAAEFWTHALVGKKHGEMSFILGKDEFILDSLMMCYCSLGAILKSCLGNAKIGDNSSNNAIMGNSNVLNSIQQNKFGKRHSVKLETYEAVLCIILEGSLWKCSIFNKDMAVILHIR